MPEVEARLNKLLEERAGIYEQMQALQEEALSEDRDFTAEEAEQYDRMEADLEAKTKEKERLEREAKRQPEFRREIVAPTENGEERVVATSLKEYRDKIAEERGDRPQDDPEYRSAFFHYMSAVDWKSELSTQELRTLSKATAAAGANLVPTTFQNELIQALREFGVTRQLASVVTTDSGETLQIPSVSSHGTAAWTAENAAYSASDEAFGQMSLSAYKAATLIQVSEELMADSAFDLEAYIREEFGARIGVLENTGYVQGDGSGKPTGYQPNVTVGVTAATGHTLDVIYDYLIDLIHSVNSAYRRNAVFVMRDASVAVVRKIKDTTGQPLWQPSLQVGQPDRLLGWPILSDPDMPAMGANAVSIVFGDFNRGYIIRDVNGIAFQRLIELYAANGQIGFRAYHRTEGKLRNANALRGYKNSAT